MQTLNGANMAERNNVILETMLDRLLATLTGGPSLNCRPHSSRQRIDLAQLGRLGDMPAQQILEELLGEKRKVTIEARIAAPARRGKRNGSPDDADETLNEAERAAAKAWTEQQNLLQKLRGVAEDARTYEQDTGAHVLHVGFPLLSLPPLAAGKRHKSARRIVAPIALVPVSLVVKAGIQPAVEIACRGEGIDLIEPNTALLAWLESQRGASADGLYADEEAKDPWREIFELVRFVCNALKLSLPDWLANLHQQRPPLATAPRGDDERQQPEISFSGVLGLFPVANQGLLRDMQAMAEGDLPAGPIESFLSPEMLLHQEEPVVIEAAQADEPSKRTINFSTDRFVTVTDPCQAQAVRMARSCPGLVVHGPPGTGKSQTITNIIGDHLARGQRVLLVCDKRTALDVVLNRLNHMGLSRLCALIHDPQRDQRDLYRRLREQLEALTDTATDPAAAKKLQKVDAELQKIHMTLSDYRTAVMDQAADPHGSLHSLIGRWLATSGTPVQLDQHAATGVTLDDVEHHGQAMREILQRAEAASYHSNPWRTAAGMPLDEFLSTTGDVLRNALRRCRELEAALPDAGGAPPLLPKEDLLQQSDARNALAATLGKLRAQVDQPTRAKWAMTAGDDIAAAWQMLQSHQTIRKTLDTALPPELISALAGKAPPMAEINTGIQQLTEYQASSAKWYGFLALGVKSRARQALSRFGLPLTPQNAQQVQTFLLGLRNRMTLQTLLAGLGDNVDCFDDARLRKRLADHEAVLSSRKQVAENTLLAMLADDLSKWLAGDGGMEFIELLHKSAARAASLAPLIEAMHASHCFNAPWIEHYTAAQCAATPPEATIDVLTNHFATFEHVLRVRTGLHTLPEALQSAAILLALQDNAPGNAMLALQRAALNNAITERLRRVPQALQTDAVDLSNQMTRYRTLEQQKMQLVRDVILDHWITRQKERMLATTGSRLNTLGADLKRRLTLRGERAMRLRQVLAAGQNVEGGDPLMDLCPVWMASPETVAQLFERKPVFDAVVFDEASQCRLEEALPVLTRARRVVIAGDPKQLPPTRFFESGLTASNQEDPETDQELFEAQQAEVEDLLGAALNISIEQCYLDVHYRSRNADLIGFSNQYFYESRLQAIPAHPSNRVRFAPLTLYRVDGIYDKRCNVAEADRVATIVRDLLKRAEPPSIGIACFNLQQRDLILERLDALAATDAEFSARLAESRARQGSASFEGLFVKNLENVQGDERDHIIISTTYGPDAQGRFYQRFGPVGRAGGGRRLNVLVTRARQEVHVVTSIPAHMYRTLPEIPAGTAPTGAWLLYAYLRYAEVVAALYAQADEVVNNPAAIAPAKVDEAASRWPSNFARQLADNMAGNAGVGSYVYWGNEGFCIDMALKHPIEPEGVTIGVLCDGTRYGRAADPVEWDIFRTAMLESQGWKLHRLWTPHFFRDAQRCREDILREHAAALKSAAGQ
jgi:hypothetical protein